MKRFASRLSGWLLCGLFATAAVAQGLQAPVQGVAAAASEVWLLGEVHDNAAAHAARADWLRARVEAGWRPAIVMEQFDRERQADLDRARAQCTDAACVVRAAGGQGWQWPLYEPVIALALRYDLPLLAGNVSRQDASRVMRGGFAAALDADTRARYRLDGALPEDLLTDQREAVRVGHCNALPENLLDGMARAQMARDVWMARLVDEHAARGVALIAGNGHVRRDLGVPRWLRTPGARVLGFTEGDEAAAYDEQRVLPPAPREDPCLAFGRPGKG